MKKIITSITAVALLSLVSCAQFQNIQQTLGSPPQVQADITILGGIAKSHLSTAAQQKIHSFATQLNQAADLNLNALYALLPPTTGSQNGDALVGAAKAYLTSVVQKYGSRNPTTIAYGHAVANGLLANF